MGTMRNQVPLAAQLLFRSSCARVGLGDLE